MATRSSPLSTACTSVVAVTAATWIDCETSAAGKVEINGTGDICTSRPCLAKMPSSLATNAVIDSGFAGTKPIAILVCATAL
jgi:hypothetical protein